jgi:hypothetical protein
VITLNTTSAIAAGGIFEHYGIYAGGSYGSRGDPVVNVNSGASTRFIGRFVDVGHNFSAQMNPGHFYEMIPTFACTFPGDTHRSIDSVVSTLSMQPENDLFNIYPNPTTGPATISYLGKSSGQLEISVKDMGGRIVHSENVNCTSGVDLQHTLDMTSFTPGIYIIELVLNGNHTAKKVVKLPE